MKLKDRIQQFEKAAGSNVRQGLRVVHKGIRQGVQLAQKGVPHVNPPEVNPTRSSAVVEDPEMPTTAAATDTLTAPTPTTTTTTPTTTTKLPSGVVPPSPDDGRYDFSYFQAWYDSLHATLSATNVLPTFESDQQTHPDPNVQNFLLTLTTIDAAWNGQKAAQTLVDQLGKAKQPPTSPEELARAQKALQDATQMVNDLLLTGEEAARVLLHTDSVLAHFVSSDYDDSNLMTLAVLQSATPKGLAAWCDRGDAPTQQLFRLLRSADLMRVFLQHGGPKNGAYGRAMELHEQLSAHQHTATIDPDAHRIDPVLERLALAVALELCINLTSFGTKHHIDPVQRYVHYEQAYLLGELDPAFPTFTVWELRNVVNSDVPDEQLGWGRQCLKNYRPDLVLTDDPQWRYCRIVKTDVAYKVPDWYKEPRSMDQILSGGGKCGPRAWYGRFACKSFGIPTWGCKQPGHAAMTRWTTKGWMTCLGAGFPYSYWENRGGLDFLLETQARAALGTDQMYLQMVLRLEWLAIFYKESNKTIVDKCMPSSDSPWWALSMMQRKTVARIPQSKPARQSDNFKIVQTHIETVQAQPDSLETIHRDLTTGRITVPAVAFGNSSRKADVMKSFLGGRQVFLKEDAVVAYVLNTDLISPLAERYRLSCRICTVHRFEQPLQLTVSVESTAADNSSTLHEIPIPYTMGMWEATEHVEVEIALKGNTTLSFARPNQQFGIALKDVELLPV
jgi:hypothetical protein